MGGDVGAGVIADGHLVGVITVDPARYQGRLVAVPASRLLADPGFRERLAGRGVRAEAAPVGGGWYLQLPGEQTVRLDPAYRPISRRFGQALPTLLRPEHGLVPFLGRQALLHWITSWCHHAASRPVLLVTGGGGSGKTRLGREACVQMLMAGWDAGLADDHRRDGTTTTRLQRPTLLVIDDADLRTALISSLIDYLRWDDAGPPVRLLLLARAPGAWWDRLVRQQELADSYMILDLDRHPVPPADRAEHFRRASAAFAAYRGPETPPPDAPPPAELDDPAYGEPLLIHIAALLRTMDTSATPSPPGPAEERARDDGSTAGQPGPPVRQALLRALCERERTRWYQLGRESHLLFNPDLPLMDQVVALATLTAAADQSCATSLLATLPDQAEVTRIGAEALVAWAHRLYDGPGYWNPLRPDLLAEQHLADTAQLPPCHHGRPAGRRAALGSWAAYPAARRTDPRRPEPGRPPGGPPRATRRGPAPDRRPGGHCRSRRTGRSGQPRAAAGAPARPGRPARRPDARTQRAARRPGSHPHKPASHSLPGGHDRRTAGRRQPPRRVTEQPVGSAGRPGAARGGAGRDHGSHRNLPGAGCQVARPRA